MKILELFPEKKEQITLLDIVKRVTGANLEMIDYTNALKAGLLTEYVEEGRRVVENNTIETPKT